MPRDPERRREQQRELMRRRRAKTKTGETETHGDSEDLGGEHYWGAVSQAPEGMRICTAFEFYGPGRWIGGCGKVVPWEGKPLPTNASGEPDLATAIIDSEHYKEIQQKMPVTKARER